MKLHKGHMLGAVHKHVGTTFGPYATGAIMLHFEVYYVEDLLKILLLLI